MAIISGVCAQHINTLKLAVPTVTLAILLVFSGCGRTLFPAEGSVAVCSVCRCGGVSCSQGAGQIGTLGNSVGNSNVDMTFTHVQLCRHQTSLLGTWIQSIK